jgi:hypothetical protein
MSRLEVPIQGRVLWATGDVLLRAELGLVLRADTGIWLLERFRIDTGTEITTMPAYRAKQLGLQMPIAPTLGVTHKQTGLCVRSGYLRFRVGGMDNTDYTIPCFFLGDPDTRPDPKQPATYPRKLLQPYQLIEWLRHTIDRDSTVAAPHGTLTIEKKTP